MDSGRWSSSVGVISFNFCLKLYLNTTKMELNKLNRLIKRIRIVSNHLACCERDPLLEESLIEYQDILKEKYGGFLEARLFDVYDDYFEDSELESVQSYLSRSGVEVEGDEFGEERLSVSIKADPIRIEIANTETKFQQVIWQAA